MARGRNNEPKVESTESSNTEFVNPFKLGVTYNQFVEALGDKSIHDYCGAHLSIEQINWLEIELEHHTKNK